MAKIFINAGHGGRDTGAVKYVIEKDVNLKIAIACRDYLTARGVDAYMSDADLNDESQSSNDILNEIAKFNPDYAIDIHNNAGGGDGFEIFKGISGLGDAIAKNIENEIKLIGQNSRGIKTKTNNLGKDYYYFIRQTSCPAVICECAFVDNQVDAAQIDTDVECKTFGEAIAKGILKTLNIEDKVISKEENKTTISTTNSIQTGQLVKVTANILNIRKSADLQSSVVGSIVDKGTYTIIDTVKADGYTWGKLKSGLGWIALEYTKDIGEVNIQDRKSAFKEYRVKVTTKSGLNVREGANAGSNKITALTYNAIVTIIDEKNNWGKIKDLDGWICLDYTKKI